MSDVTYSCGEPIDGDRLCTDAKAHREDQARDAAVLAALFGVSAVVLLAVAASHSPTEKVTVTSENADVGRT